MRQEPILQEAAARIRRYAGLRQTERHRRPLIVILTKFDAWCQLLGSDPPDDPWLEVRGADSRGNGYSAGLCGLDVAAVEHQSKLARVLLLKLSPDTVTGAEGSAEDVLY